MINQAVDNKLLTFPYKIRAAEVLSAILTSFICMRLQQKAIEHNNTARENQRKKNNRNFIRPKFITNFKKVCTK